MCKSWNTGSVKQSFYIKTVTPAGPGRVETEYFSNNLLWKMLTYPNIKQTSIHADVENVAIAALWTDL